MEQEQTISLQELFQVLKKRLFLIITITLAAVAISAAVSYFVLTPVYEVKTTMMAYGADKKLESDSNSLTEIQTNLKLINTYNDLIKSDKILEKVLNELELDMTMGQLARKINVSNNKESHVIYISVKDTDPYRAAEIANMTAQIFEKEIQQEMNASIKQWSRAKVSENQAPVEPKPLLNIAIAAIIGLMLGVGLAFLLEFLDNTIKTEQDIENTLELPVIGVIMDITDFVKENEVVQAMRKPARGGENIGS